MFKLKSVSFNGQICYLNTTTELELSNNISSYLHHVPKNHIYSLLTPELVIGNNKRLDFGTDANKFNQRLSKELRDDVGSRKNAVVTMVELKRDKVDLNILNETILSTHLDGKRYIANYVSYLRENDIEPKLINLLFVAPNTFSEGEVGVIQEDFNQITKNFINLKFIPYVKFYSNIYNLLPWYVTQELPPLFFSIEKGKKLLQNKLAIKE